MTGSCRARTALAALSLGLAACGSARLADTSGGIPMAGSCVDAAGREAARFVDREVLPLEASGQRLRELLGRERVETFYAMVRSDPTQEPGWDVIAVRDGYRVVRVDCNADDVAQRDVRVLFPAGPWFDREGTGSAAAVEETYSVGRTGTILQVTSRLPAPFVSPQGARRLLGQAPYDKPRLVEFRSRLRD